jgi:hypothetical protein
MIDDVVERCREVVTVLTSASPSASQLGSAAMLLRAAADDLASLTELVEGPTSGREDPSATPTGFDLAFGNAIQSNRHH